MPFPLLHTTLHFLPELVSPVERFLLYGQNYRPQVLVIGEVIPVFSAVKVLLVRLLFDASKLETLILLPLFLDGRLLPGQRRIVVVLVVLVQIVATPFLPARYQTVLLRPVGVVLLVALLDLVIRLGLIPDRVRGDLLSRTLDPVARCRDEVVRELLAELIWKLKTEFFWVGKITLIKYLAVTT